MLSQINHFILHLDVGRNEGMVSDCPVIISCIKFVPPYDSKFLEEKDHFCICHLT